MSYPDENRPILEIPKDRNDIIIEYLTLILLILIIVNMASSYGSLSDSIPSHMNIKDEIDGYSHKSMLWVIIGILMLTVSFNHFLQSIPHRFNYMVKITKDNAMQQYASAIKMMKWLNLSIVLLFSMIILKFIDLDGKHFFTPPTWIIWFLCLVMIILPFYFIYKTSVSK